MMKYKGYTAKIELDEEQGFFHGEVLGIVDVVTFQGKSVRELKKAFTESVDDYLEFCEDRGETPDKSFSGRFVLRLEPGLHREISITAEESGQSLNQWVVSCLEYVLEKQPSATWSKHLEPRRYDWHRVLSLLSMMDLPGSPYEWAKEIIATEEGLESERARKPKLKVK